MVLSGLFAHLSDEEDRFPAPLMVGRDTAHPTATATVATGC